MTFGQTVHRGSMYLPKDMHDSSGLQRLYKKPKRKKIEFITQ